MSTTRTVVRTARPTTKGVFMVYGDDNRALLDRPLVFSEAKAIAQKFAATNKRCARIARVGELLV